MKKGNAWLLVIVFLFTALTGCGGMLAPTGKADYNEVTIEGKQNSGAMRIATPTTKPDGSKFQVAYVDIDEYLVTSQMFYYVIEALREYGWISYDALPMSVEEADAGKLVSWLASKDLGPYMTFSDDMNYYLQYDTEAYVAEDLKNHAANGEVDIILTMGTWAAKVAKQLNLKVPLMIHGCVDPVGSQLIDSIEDSGNDYIWAQADVGAYTRQLQFYYDTVPFTNIGMVYTDAQIAALDSYQKAAEQNGFRITSVPIEKDSDESAYYTALEAIYKDLITNKKIDAYLLNTDVMINDTKASKLFDLFYANKIPVFLQIGENFMSEGAFMMVAPRDYQGEGYVVANAMGEVLNGTKPRELPQEYIGTPYLSINIDAAEKIGYVPTFEMLLSCEKIYTNAIGGE